MLHCIVQGAIGIYLNNEPQKATYCNKVFLFFKKYIYIYYFGIKKLHLCIAYFVIWHL
jgi:hypothetical protein